MLNFTILRVSAQNLPPFPRGRFWADRGSVMSWHLGRNVESKNIFGCLKIRFEGVGYEIFGGRLWKNRTRGVGYEILVVDFQKFWLGGSVMRFLWFGFEKFWLWGVCYEIFWFGGRFWKFVDVGGRFWDFFIWRGRFWEILRKSGTKFNPLDNNFKNWHQNLITDPPSSKMFITDPLEPGFQPAKSVFAHDISTQVSAHNRPPVRSKPTPCERGGRFWDDTRRMVKKFLGMMPKTFFRKTFFFGKSLKK